MSKLIARSAEAGIALLAAVFLGPAWAAYEVQIEYTYDAIGRLTHIVYSTGQETAYVYDPAGNIITITHDGSAVLRMLSVRTFGPGTVSLSPQVDPLASAGDERVFAYPGGSSVLLTPSAVGGAAFIGWQGACVGDDASCSVGMNDDRQVLAAFAMGPTYNAGVGPLGGRIMTGAGTSVLGVELIGGGGWLDVQMLGGVGSWAFTSAEVLNATGGFGRPRGVRFPFGLTSLELALGAPGSSVSLTMNYPRPLPVGARFYVFGATSGNPVPHWYELETASIEGSLVSLVLVDGGAGDRDALANQVITMLGGPGVIAPRRAPVWRYVLE